MLCCCRLVVGNEISISYLNICIIISKVAISNCDVRMKKKQINKTHELVSQRKFQIANHSESRSTLGIILIATTISQGNTVAVSVLLRKWVLLGQYFYQVSIRIVDKC